MKIHYTDTAQIEAEDIFAHIARDNPAAAIAVATAIRDAIETLAAFPHIGAVTNDPHIFIKIARPYHYLIFYSVDRDTVLIRRVRHPARRPPIQ